jgi:hypothetical protein
MEGSAKSKQPSSSDAPNAGPSVTEHARFAYGPGDYCAQSLSALIPHLPQAMADGEVIDLILPGSDVPLEADGIENTQAVLLDPVEPSATLRKMSAGRRYILIRNILQQLADYRSILQAAFDRLAVDGWLVVTVPHQFLAERKFRLPSRYGSKSLRLYTPASLIAEIEEALDPTEYRIRLLRDDDEAYEYDRPIGERPEGHQRIVIAVQKIARPSWAAQMDQDDRAEVAYDKNDTTMPTDTGPTVTHILSASNAAVKSILALKLDHRGDYLMAQPALSQLRAHFPDAHITFVCGTWNYDLAHASGVFDEVIPFDFFAEDASLKREPRRDEIRRQFADLMHVRSFDLAIDLRCLEDTRDLMRGVNARHKAGFDRWNEFPWLDIKLNLPFPTLDGRAMHSFLQADAFSCPEDHRRDDSIVCPAASLLRPKTLAVWGPYVELHEGDYEVTIHVDAPQRLKRIKADIVCNKARTTLFSGPVPLSGARDPVIKLKITERVQDLEIRLYAPPVFRPAYRFRGMRFRSAGVIIGQHQFETMMLLVELVAMRLRMPYLHELQQEGPA